MSKQSSDYISPCGGYVIRCAKSRKKHKRRAFFLGVGARENRVAYLCEYASFDTAYTEMMRIKKEVGE